MRKTVKTIALVAIIIGVVNFAAFIIAVQSLGGDAINGEIVGNQYYVSNHGRSTQVSKGQFYYIKYHAYSLFVTHPIGALGSIVWVGIFFGVFGHRKKTVSNVVKGS